MDMDTKICAVLAAVAMSVPALADTVCTPRLDGGLDCQETATYSTTTIAPNAAGGFDVYESSPGVASGYQNIQPAPQPELPTHQGIDMTMPAQQQYVPPSTAQPTFGSYEAKAGKCRFELIDPETGESQGCAK